MLEVGLTPSSTGEPGGNMTGQKMSDYPTPDGAFLKALDNLPHAFKLPFISTEGMAKAETAGGSSEPKPKNKVKYSCHQCKTNVWGNQILALYAAIVVRFSNAWDDRPFLKDRCLGDIEGREPR